MPEKPSVVLWKSAAPLIVLAAAFVLYLLLFEPLLDGHSGAMGADYSEVLPRLLGEYYWFHKNGWFAVPWFTPAFCGGMPEWGNPQSIPYSLPQWLVFSFDPVTALQITFVVYALAGLAGMWLLVRHSLRASRAAATLASVLFLFNGFFIARMAVGHLEKAPFMLAPAAGWLLTRSARTGAGRVLSTLAAGFLVMVMLQGAMLVILPPVVMAWIAIGLIQGMRTGRSRETWIRLASALAIGGLLSVSKLTAVEALLAQFPRDEYGLPGFRTVSVLVQAFINTVFWRGLPEPAGDFVGFQYTVEIQERQFGISPVPLLILFLAGGWSLDLKKTRNRLMLGGLLVLMLLPLAVNLHGDGWTPILKSLPVIKSLSSLTRWFVLYIVVFPVLTALATDHFRRPVLVAGLGVAGVVAWNATGDHSLFSRPYTPDTIVKAWNAVHGGGPVPSISRIDVPAAGQPFAGDDDVARGANQVLCYEPLFGYRLEKLPWKPLHPGSPLAAAGGVLNIKDPRCELYPEENHCRPGDQFPVSGISDAEAFIDWKPLNFERSPVQRLADGVNLVAIVLFASGLAGTLVVRRRRPPPLAEDVTPPKEQAQDRSARRKRSRLRLSGPMAVGAPPHGTAVDRPSEADRTEAPPRTTGLRRDDVVMAAVVGTIALLLYVLTMYPDLTGGDAGELIAAVATGGVIHPPGYPLYALLGHIFAALPGGSLAWRFNLMSGVCDAAAAAVFCLAVSTWTRSRWAGLAAASLFAFSPGVWLYAIGAEVFALNNLFVALLMLLAVLYDRSKDARYAYAGALAFGLGLSNHQTILFCGLPLACWVLWTGRSQLLQPRALVRLVVLCLLGLLPYAQLVIAGAHEAGATWGQTSTWDGFWTHVLRRTYGTFRLSTPGDAPTVSRLDVVYAWAGDLLKQAGWWGILLALIGIRRSVFRRRAERIGFAVVAVIPPLLSVFVFTVVSQRSFDAPIAKAILARFWQQTDLFVFLFVGYALALGAARLRRPGVFPAICVAVALLQPALHYRALDHHQDTIIRDYGAELLRVAPLKTVLIARGDLIDFVLRYLHTAEGQRPDLQIVEEGMMGLPWYVARWRAGNPGLELPADGVATGPGEAFPIREFANLNNTRYAVMTCGGLGTDYSEGGRYPQWPVGACEVLLPAGQGVSIDNWVKESEAALPQLEFGSDEPEPSSWERVVWDDYWAARIVRAGTLLNVAGADPSQGRYAQLAAEELDAALRRNPRLAPLSYRLLALARSHPGVATSAETRQAAVDAWRKYLSVNKPSDAEMAEITGVLVNLTGQQAAQVGGAEASSH